MIIDNNPTTTDTSIPPNILMYWSTGLFKEGNIRKKIVKKTIIDAKTSNK